MAVRLRFIAIETKGYLYKMKIRVKEEDNNKLLAVQITLLTQIMQNCESTA